MWTAVSGAAARNLTVETVANNLANSDTLGFKRDVPAFKEYLTALEHEPEPKEALRRPIQEKDFHPTEGRDQAYIVADGTYTDFSQGHLRVTNSPLDIALDGPGFLEVSTPFGIRYTRHGSLKLATDGRLVTSDGFPVLAAQPGGLAGSADLAAGTVQPGQGGLVTQGGVTAGQTTLNGPASRFINMKDRASTLSITETGDVYAGEALVAKLSVVEFQDPKRLRKAGMLFFENPSPNNFTGRPPTTTLRQGMLETSNVNPVREMTELIKAHRLFENDTKSIKTFSEMMGREANDIGKL